MEEAASNKYDRSLEALDNLVAQIAPDKLSEYHSKIDGFYPNANSGKRAWRVAAREQSQYGLDGVDLKALNDKFYSDIRSAALQAIQGRRLTEHQQAAVDAHLDTIKEGISP